MTTAVFLNGRFVERGEASVSAFDAAMQHGVGLFETMSGRLEANSDGQPRARVFGLMDHLDRLIASAAALGLSDSLKREPLAVAVEQTVERSGIAHSRVRLTVTGGDLNLLGKSDGATERQSDEGGEKRSGTSGGGHDPTLLIVAQEATRYPDEMFARGARVAIADTKANPLNLFEGHKTLNYWWRLRELQAAAARGLDESIVFQISNHLAGGCVSNVFVVKDGVLVTPIARGEEKRIAGKVTLSSPVLPGITRRFVLENAVRKGIHTNHRMLSISDVLDAHEVFMTNSSFGILPVVAVEAERIGDGKVGPVAREMREAWLTANE
jgi:branched-chain amino acid aminotransferase